MVVEACAKTGTAGGDAQKMEGVLYLCGTPIGNLEDVTLRALRVLKESDLIAAEDTRRIRKLLRHYDIRTPVISHHSHNEERRIPEILSKLRLGKTVSLVSDAGMPGISDPGSKLVRAAIAEGIRVVPIPGPSAAILALVVSGLPSGRFAFEGFLPSVRSRRLHRLAELAGESRTLIFFESPRRLLETLSDIEANMGKRRIAIAREMTKQFEEIIRGRVDEVRNSLAREKLRGEVTLVVEGKVGGGDGMPQPINPEASNVCRAVEEEMSKGVAKMEAIKAVAKKLGLPKGQVYSEVVGRDRRKESDEE